MGHPLSQTLFTSIYLDRLLWPIPAAIEDARFDRGQATDDKHSNDKDRGGPLVNLVLRAFCLALVKSCDRVIARVSSEYYFEVNLCTYEYCIALC